MTEVNIYALSAELHWEEMVQEAREALLKKHLINYEQVKELKNDK